MEKNKFVPDFTTVKSTFIKPFYNTKYEARETQYLTLYIILNETRELIDTP